MNCSGRPGSSNVKNCRVIATSGSRRIVPWRRHTIYKSNIFSFKRRSSTPRKKVRILLRMCCIDFFAIPGSTGGRLSAIKQFMMLVNFIFRPTRRGNILVVIPKKLSKRDGRNGKRRRIRKSAPMLVHSFGLASKRSAQNHRITKGFSFSQRTCFFPKRKFCHTRKRSKGSYDLMRRSTWRNIGGSSSKRNSSESFSKKTTNWTVVGLTPKRRFIAHPKHTIRMAKWEKSLCLKLKIS